MLKILTVEGIYIKRHQFLRKMENLRETGGESEGSEFLKLRKKEFPICIN